jgi:hypothetical protein
MFLTFPGIFTFIYSCTNISTALSLSYPRMWVISSSQNFTNPAALWQGLKRMAARGPHNVFRYLDMIYDSIYSLSDRSVRCTSVLYSCCRWIVHNPCYKTSETGNNAGCSICWWNSVLSNIRARPWSQSLLRNKLRATYMSDQNLERGRNLREITVPDGTCQLRVCVAPEQMSTLYFSS